MAIPGGNGCGRGGPLPWYGFQKVLTLKWVPLSVVCPMELEMGSRAASLRQDIKMHSNIHWHAYGIFYEYSKSGIRGNRGPNNPEPDTLEQLPGHAYKPPTAPLFDTGDFQPPQ